MEARPGYGSACDASQSSLGRLLARIMSLIWARSRRYEKHKHFQKGGRDHASGARDRQEMRAVVCAEVSGQSAVRKGVSAQGLVRCISVAARQQTLRYCSNWPIYAAFSFAMRACRGQDYLMHLVRAPSCKRRGFGGRHTMAGPLLRTVPRHLV